MHALVLHLLPIAGGCHVPKRVQLVVHRKLGHTGCAGGEVADHQVVFLQLGVFVIVGLSRFHAIVKRQPTLALAVCNQLPFQAGAFGFCKLDLLEHKVVVGGKHHADVRVVDAVNQVF